jgi:CheY-like chemotaxis protein
VGKAQIMVVEDETLVAMALQSYLESVGYSVPLVATTGIEALEGFKRLEPDLVLMDIHLKGTMSGIEAAGRIKDSYRVPVIYLTAYSDAATLEFAKGTEPYGYVMKPFDERSLEATIEMALYKAAILNEGDRTRERMESALESLAEGVILAGMNGAVEYCNPAALRILGLDGPLAPGSSVFKVLRPFAPGTGQPIPLRLEEIVLERKSTKLRGVEIVLAGGATRSIDLAMEARKDERGIVRGAVISIHQVAAG